MRRTILVYGAALALLVFGLKMIEYRFLVRDLSLEFYLGVVAVLFTAVGIWAGVRLTGKSVMPASAAQFPPDEATLKHLGISKREHEVLSLIAKGFSNQEIADTLFVSVNTVKTHSSNLFMKLSVKRRTQAVQEAKRMGLIP